MKALFFTMIFLTAFLITSAQSIFMEANGQSQGKFSGDVMQKGREKTSKVANYEYETNRAYRIGPGTTQRSDKIFILTKEYDAMSLQFYSASVKNELLKNVTLMVYTPTRLGVSGSAAGAETLALKIEILDATVIGYKEVGVVEGNGNRPQDEIKLSFRTIRFTNMSNGMSVEENGAN